MSRKFGELCKLTDRWTDTLTAVVHTPTMGKVIMGVHKVLYST